MGRLEREVAKAEHVERMAFIREQIEKAVWPYRENTEAAVVAGAAIQVARTLFELYPDSKRRELVEGAVAFLKREDLTISDGGILLPKALM